MSDILVAADETAATELMHDAETALGQLSRSGSGSLGPFNTNWGASAFFANGAVDLIPPDVIRLANCELHYKLNFALSFDLSSILPDFCLPQICITLFKKKICTPQVCVNWPTITIPLNHSDMVKFTADFKITTQLVGANWKINAVILGVPNLQISVAAAAILAALGLAAGVVLLPIPFIGPFLAVAVAGITAAVGIAGVTGFLGPILSLFVAGLTFNLYNQPKVFTLLPASLPLDPAVKIKLDLITASVSGTNEDELVLTADIS